MVPGFVMGCNGDAFVVSSDVTKVHKSLDVLHQMTENNVNDMRGASGDQKFGICGRKVVPHKKICANSKKTHNSDI